MKFSSHNNINLLVIDKFTKCYIQVSCYILHDMSFSTNSDYSFRIAVIHIILRNKYKCYMNHSQRMQLYKSTSKIAVKFTYTYSDVLSIDIKK